MSKAAVEFATKKHDGQTRSAGVPYITHPIRVMETVSKYTSNENIIIAAVLHDTLEDTPTTFDEIATTFSTDAANFVKEVTSDDTKLQQLAEQEYEAHVNKKDHATHALAKQMSEKIPDIDGKTLKKRLGKSLYLSQKTMGMTTGALLIKLADRFVVKHATNIQRLDNVRDMSDWPASKQLEYALETNFILEQLTRSDLDSSHQALISSIRQVIDPILA